MKDYPVERFPAAPAVPVGPDEEIPVPAALVGTPPLHPSIATLELPSRMRELPRDRNGYPVPYFVAWIDGVPDFRVVDPRRLLRCMRDRRCWTCGQRMVGPTATFVIGPMCAVNRTSSEPPSHYDCATYSARACPFLANPRKRRREGNKPDHEDPGGIMLTRNPGVALLWTTRHWKTISVENGFLFRLGDPTRVAWLAEGRDATHAEVMASIESGLPVLRDMAAEEGPDAEAELRGMIDVAMHYVPRDETLPRCANCGGLNPGDVSHTRC